MPTPKSSHLVADRARAGTSSSPISSKARGSQEGAPVGLDNSRERCTEIFDWRAALLSSRRRDRVSFVSDTWTLSTLVPANSATPSAIASFATASAMKALRSLTVSVNEPLICTVAEEARVVVVMVDVVTVTVVTVGVVVLVVVVVTVDVVVIVDRMLVMVTVELLDDVVVVMVVVAEVVVVVVDEVVVLVLVVLVILVVLVVLLVLLVLLDVLV